MSEIVLSQTERDSSMYPIIGRAFAYFKMRMLPARGRLYPRSEFAACLLFIVGAFIHGALVARSLPAAGPLRFHPLVTVDLSFERSTVISMCVANPDSPCVRCLFKPSAAKASIGRSHCPVVVRSLPVQSSQPVCSQYTACSPRIKPDLVKFFGIFETSGYGQARGQPDLGHWTETYQYESDSKKSNEIRVYLRRAGCVLRKKTEGKLWIV